MRHNTYLNPYLSHRAEDGGDYDELLQLTTRATVGRLSPLHVTE